MYHTGLLYGRKSLGLSEMLQLEDRGSGSSPISLTVGIAGAALLSVIGPFSREAKLIDG